MKIEKFTTAILVLITSIVCITSLVTAINLEVTPNEISKTALTDLNQPAIFDLSITNNEATDSFQIYSLIGINITPQDSFTITSGEIKIIRIYLTPQESFNARDESLPFVYQIKNSKNEIQKETLTINIMDLDRAIIINPENINPQSSNINIEIKNRATYEYKDLKLKLSSVFFEEFSTTINLKSLETKTIPIPLDSAKLKKLDAGQYLMNSQLETQGITAKKDNIIKFVEKANIETTTTNEGLIIKRTEITKKNLGNVKERVQITVEKSFISYLFTTFNTGKDNIRPLTSFEGFTRVYTWEKELIPDDELTVIITTNWTFPILIIIFIIVALIVIKKYVERDFTFRKTVSFVRTKGGEFALRVSLRIKAKKYAERINITDKLPHLVNLYEKFGAVPPHKIDLNNRRVEWNIESMNKGEERIFSYIMYSSKIGVVGRFELPSAKAVYERDGKIKEITSNRSFFINEPKQKI